jgi:hypothetical protein
MSIDLLRFLLTSVLFSEHKLNEHRFIAFLLTSVLFSEHKLNEHRFIAVSFNFHFIKWPQTNLSWTHCILIYLMPYIALFLIIPIYRWHCVVSRFTGGILLFHDLPVALCCFTIYRWHCVVSHLSVLTSITKRKQQVDCSLNAVMDPALFLSRLWYLSLLMSIRWTISLSIFLNFCDFDCRACVLYSIYPYAIKQACQ